MKNIRLICLNTAAGMHGNVEAYLKKQKSRTDVFCLQEVNAVYHNPSESPIRRDLPYHHAKGARINLPTIASALARPKAPVKFGCYYGPHLSSPELPTHCLEGNAMLFNPSIIENRFACDSEAIFAGCDRNTAVTLQWMLIDNVAITNVHGLWDKNGKGDTFLRLMQSRLIVQALERLKRRFHCEFVVTGDFNLLPFSSSVSMVEGFGLRNLIKEYRITSTRTTYYRKPGKFADYIFVSSGITVNDFKVNTRSRISDHAPMYLDFSVE